MVEEWHHGSVDLVVRSTGRGGISFQPYVTAPVHCDGSHGRLSQCEACP